MSISVSGSQITFNDASTQNTAATGFGFKNRLINGAMGIWQRGTSGFTSSGNYSADRFATFGTLTAVAQSTDVPSGFQYSLLMSGSSSPSIQQKIESKNCIDLSGSTVTISFWAKQSTGASSGSIALQLFNATSTDSTYTNQIGSTASFTGTSSWAQYTATFTSLPAGAVNGLNVVIYSNVSGSSVFLLTGVQLEKGSTATSFDYRPYGTELALCQRYFEQLKTGSNYVYGPASAFNTTNIRGYVPFQVQKRTNPTMTYQTAGSFFLQGNNGNLTPSAVSDLGATTYSDFISFTVSGAVTGYSYMIIDGSGTSYIQASAEL